MKEPTSASEVFTNFGIGGTPDVRSGTEEDLPAAPAGPEAERDDAMPRGEHPLPKPKEPEVAGQKTQAAEPSPRPAPGNEASSALRDLLATVEQLERDVKAVAESSGKTAGEIREMHKLYHNEFASRLVSMQEDLEQYREIERGRVFDGILGEIAKLYSDNETIVDEIAENKPRKRLRYMFMDILQILETNGVSMQKSKPGDKRNTRHCQVIDRVSTSEPSLHDTVIRSRGTGFYVENRPLIKELVDVYLFSDTAADHPTEY